MLYLFLFTIVSFLFFNSSLNLQNNYVSSKEFYSARHISIENNLAYITASSGGLFIYNISDDLNPYPLGHFDKKGNYFFNLFVEDDFAYIADGQNFLVLDISNPTKITEKYNYNFGGNCRDVFKHGDFVFVTATDGCFIFNVSDIENIQEVYNNDLSHARGVYSENDILYVTESDKLLLLNISDIQNVSEIGSYQSSETLKKMDKTEKYLHITCIDRKMEIIDVSNSLNPFKVCGYTTPGNVNGIDCVGNYTYIANGYEGFTIVDNSNISSPHILSNLPLLGHFPDVQVIANKAYLTGEGSGVYILNITNPNIPSIISKFQLIKPVNTIRNIVLPVVLVAAITISLTVIGTIIYKKREKIGEYVKNNKEKIGYWSGIIVSILIVAILLVTYLFAYLGLIMASVIGGFSILIGSFVTGYYTSGKEIKKRVSIACGIFTGFSLLSVIAMLPLIIYAASEFGAKFSAAIIFTVVGITLGPAVIGYPLGFLLTSKISKRK